MWKNIIRSWSYKAFFAYRKCLLQKWRSHEITFTFPVMNECFCIYRFAYRTRVCVRFSHFEKAVFCFPVYFDAYFMGIRFCDANILNLYCLPFFGLQSGFFCRFPTDSCNILYYLMAVMEYLLSTKPSRLRLENREILIQFLSRFIFKVQDKSFLTWKKNNVLFEKF